MKRRDILQEAWDAYYREDEDIISKYGCCSINNPDGHPTVTHRFVYFSNCNGPLGRYNIRTREMEYDYRDLGY